MNEIPCSGDCTGTSQMNAVPWLHLFSVCPLQALCGHIGFLFVPVGFVVIVSNGCFSLLSSVLITLIPMIILPVFLSFCVAFRHSHLVSSPDKTLVFSLQQRNTCWKKWSRCSGFAEVLVSLLQEVRKDLGKLEKNDLCRKYHCLKNDRYFRKTKFAHHLEIFQWLLVVLWPLIENRNRERCLTKCDFSHKTKLALISVHTCYTDMSP